MHDIAAAVGLSQSTVSLALRNNPQIPKSRRLEIQAAARKLGYIPNAAAISLAHCKRNSRSAPVKAALAWINPLADPKLLRGYKEFDAYWHGAATCAEKFGFRLEEFLLNEDMTAKRIEKILLTRQIQGIVIPPIGVMEVDWAGFRWDRFSVIRFGRTNASPRSHFVTAAQIANTFLAVDKIRERGYRRIGYVGKFHRHLTFGAAFVWMQNEIEASSQIPPFLHDEDAEDKASFSKALVGWLERERPDAILTRHKTLPEVLAQAGCRVPEDVAVAGTSVLDVPVSAGIDQRPMEIGRVAILNLISLINDNERGLPLNRREILVQGEWVDGPSLPWRQAGKAEKSFESS